MTIRLPLKLDGYKIRDHKGNIVCEMNINHDMWVTLAALFVMKINDLGKEICIYPVEKEE